MMSTSNQSAVAPQTNGRTGRIGERMYAGRRRIATGAAVVFALGLGYHVIVGHNGLIVYEQKRHNQVMLDKELGALQRWRQS